MYRISANNICAFSHGLEKTNPDAAKNRSGGDKAIQPSLCFAPLSFNFGFNRKHLLFLHFFEM